MSNEEAEGLKKKIAIWTATDNPFRQFLGRIGDKWSLLVIFVLLSKPEGRCRFSELKREITGISQRMLTTTLRNLEADGLVTRHVYPEIPPRVEYELTELGRSIKAPIKSLLGWVKQNWPAAKEFRRKHVYPSHPRVSRK